MTEKRLSADRQHLDLGLPGGVYEARFDTGHHFRLFDRYGTFRVSRAGLALGNYLVRDLSQRELSGRILEVGTGSGVIALLLRSMGAGEIAATDISASSVCTAKQNELANFGDQRIDFTHGDLFPRGADSRHEGYDLIVFNPPGWRSPSPSLEVELAAKQGCLNLEAMFYGESVLLRFLQELPAHLSRGGRAIVGLNSLIGIDDVLGRASSMHRAGGRYVLHSQLLERCEFPLFLYSDEWVEVRDLLLTEFKRGRHEYAATFESRGETIHWFYEITEITADRLPVAAQPPDVKQLRGHSRSRLWQQS